MLLRVFTILSLSSLMIFNSCVGRKISKVKSRLEVIQEKKDIEETRMNELLKTGDEKLNENKIDSNINKILSGRILKYQHRFDSVEVEIAYIEALMKSKRAFRKAYKKKVIPSLNKLDSMYTLNKGRFAVYMMFDDALNTNSFALFDLAAFFGPGQFSIPQEMEATSLNTFSPLIDSLKLFSNKYKDIRRTATLIILGFADGQDINRDSDLCDTLVMKVGDPTATKQMLNQKLSELRADELIRLLTKLFLQKLPQFEKFETLNVEYIGQGKGEQYPMRSIKDYREDDERRRIVMCYWSVLPDTE